jgi:hypothetical protein
LERAAQLMVRLACLELRVVFAGARHNDRALRRIPPFEFENWWSLRWEASATRLKLAMWDWTEESSRPQRCLPIPKVNWTS